MIGLSRAARKEGIRDTAVMLPVMKTIANATHPIVGVRINRLVIKIGRAHV